MNIDQVKWASRHDWYVRSIKHDDGTYSVVACEWLNDGTEWKSVEVTTKDFQELRAWAGY